MKYIRLILFIYLLSFRDITLSAFEAPNFCFQAKDKIDCTSSSNEFLKNQRAFDLNSKIGTLFQGSEEYLFTKAQIDKLFNANKEVYKGLDQLKSQLKNKEQPSEQITDLFLNFDSLTDISIEIERSKNKFIICRHSCSPTRLIELENEINSLQKIRIQLLLANPILANEKFEQMIKGLSEQQIVEGKHFTHSEFETVLSGVLSSTLSQLKQKAEAYTQFNIDNISREKDENLIFRNNDTALKKLIQTNPDIIEEFILSATKDASVRTPFQQKIICRYSDFFKSYLQNEKINDLALDTTLLVAPLVSGPLYPYLEAGILSSRAIRLAAWGIKDYELTSKMIPVGRISQYALVGKFAQDTFKLKEDCQKIQLKLLSESDQDTYEEFQECQKMVANQILLFDASAALLLPSLSKETIKAIQLINQSAQKIISGPLVSISQETSHGVAHYLINNGTRSLGKSDIGISFNVPHEGTYSVLKLKKIETTNRQTLKTLPSRYWDFVAKIYNDRLKLTPEEIRDFINSSNQSNGRTILVTNSNKPLSQFNSQFNGGIALVESNGPQELLPFEKATNIRIMDRKPGEKFVEVVRLTTSKDLENASAIADGLMNQLFSIIAQDKSISRIYIYTSKAHTRMYKSIGVPMNNVKKLNDRDNLIEITREEAETLVRSRIH